MAKTTDIYEKKIVNFVLDEWNSIFDKNKMAISFELGGEEKAKLYRAVKITTIIYKKRILLILSKVAKEFKRSKGLTTIVIGLEKAKQIIEDLERWERNYENIGPYGVKGK